MKALYCCIIFLIGCAQVPKPSMYPYTLQQHMQAAYHWNVLANRVVEELAAGLKSGSGTSTEWVYIESYASEPPFNQGYRSFLITELRKRNLQISMNPNNPIKIGWDIQLVVHNAYREN